MTAIKSPNEGYSGKKTFGATVLEFKDGVAEAKDVPEGVLGYLRSKGYAIDGKAVEQPAEPEPIDSRDIVDQQVGSKLRDGAVDPHPDDFLAPINAGEADPHGPKVVAPQLHAAEEQPVRPGEVSDDAARQDAAESEHAAEVIGVEAKKAPAKRTTAKKATPKGE